MVIYSVWVWKVYLHLMGLRRHLYMSAKANWHKTGEERKGEVEEIEEVRGEER